MQGKVAICIFNQVCQEQHKPVPEHSPLKESDDFNRWQKARKSSLYKVSWGDNRRTAKLGTAS